jgi:hypothetical protein
MSINSDRPGSGVAGLSARKRANKNYKNKKYRKSWEKGAIGEEYLGSLIESLSTNHGFRFLHDRRIPGSQANIDHILVTDRGVFVIDAKNYKGAVRVKESGGFFTPATETLFVGNRNQTKLVLGVKKQVNLVAEAISQESLNVPVIGVLAFTMQIGPYFLNLKKLMEC